MKRLFRPETLFFVLVWLGLMVAFRDRGFYDPGALWHVKVGEIILDRGMPRTDPFSYTFEGHLWVPQQWGAEVLMALAHRAGGLDAMLLCFATCVALLFTVIFRRCVQGGMGPLLAGAVVGGVLAVGAFHFFVRPHMFTIAFLAWTMMCIVDYESGRCSEWRLVGLIPLYVLWVNLHGGVLGGMATLACAVAGWGMAFLASARNRRGEGEKGRRGEESQVNSSPPLSPSPFLPFTPVGSWRTLGLLVGIVTACGLTAFVNPHGLEMIRGWHKIVGSKVLSEIINEHMPMDPTSPLGVTVLALGCFYLFLLAGALPQVPRVSWLLPLVWLALSFKGIRQGPLFAVCAGVAVADLWKHTLWHRLLLKYGDGSTAWNTDDGARAESRRSPVWAALLVPALLVAVSWKLQTHRVPAPVVGHGWARLNPALVPSDMTKDVTEYAASVPAGTPIFNDANLGGYLIYHAPTLKVFMDDRCELYGDADLKFYTDTMNLPPDELGTVFEGWAALYKFERAIVMTSPPGEDKPQIELYLLSVPERWREVSRGQRAAMFERVGPVTSSK